MRTRPLAAVVAVAALLASAVGLSGAVAATVALTPDADTYIQSDQPTTAYGTRTTIRVDGSPTVRALLRFTVNAAVTSATLRIWANSAQTTGYDANRVASTAWSETGTTWNNQPLVGSKIGSSGPVTAGTWTQIDVTSYVTSSGTFSIGLSTTSVTALSLASRESGSNAPQLVVTSGATPTPTSTPAPTATPTPTPSPSPSPTGTPAGSIVVTAAGDIACDPGSNTGAPASCDQMGTAALIASINPAAVLTLGDNQYENGTLSAFQQVYGPSWGQHLAKTYPAIGNHEYLTSGAAGYFGYFGSRAPSSYYSYNLGAWHFISLNSECSHIAGGCTAGGAQETWLKADLAAHPGQCVLAYWHEPRWSNGQHGNATQMTTIWNDLVAAKATLVLSGHNHDYERYAPMNASGVKTTGGVREFVVGTGGKNHYAITAAPMAAQEVSNDKTFGVLKLTLSSGAYSWQFVPAAGYTFTDAGSGTC